MTKALDGHEADTLIDLQKTHILHLHKPDAESPDGVHATDIGMYALCTVSIWLVSNPFGFPEWSLTMQQTGNPGVQAKLPQLTCRQPPPSSTA